MLEALEDRYTPAPLMVITNADSGAGSLRAILNDPTLQNGATINFDPIILKGQTITLTSGQINLNKSVIIDGQNLGIIISGNNASRIFYNRDATLSETISNLTFGQGKAVGNVAPDFGRGGAIHDLGNLTLSNDLLMGNHADGSGGAVYASGGTLTVTNCKFNSNGSNSHDGGAICVGVEGVSGNITLDSTAFTSNTASGSGGAVDAEGQTATKLTVTSCDFTSNNTSIGGGGAICTSDQLSVTGGSFTGNQAGISGGAINYGFSATVPTDSGSMTLKNITFKNNTAGAYGGAVESFVFAKQGTAAVSVIGCLFTGNQATMVGVLGGGLYVRHTTSGTGSASLTITNSTFYNNSSVHGGGIALNNDTAGGATNTVSLTSLTVNKNQAMTDGGGLWISAATGVPGLRPQVTNSIFAGNQIGGMPADGPDVFGNALSLGFNLIGKTDGSGNTVWLSNDWTGTNANPQDPGLDAAGPTDHGGLTFTIKLATTSVGYQTGNRLLLNGSPDQRGYTRPKTPNKVSIGAYDPDATAP